MAKIDKENLKTIQKIIKHANNSSLAKSKLNILQDLIKTLKKSTNLTDFTTELESLINFD